MNFIWWSLSWHQRSHYKNKSMKETKNTALKASGWCTGVLWGINITVVKMFIVVKVKFVRSSCHSSIYTQREIKWESTVLEFLQELLTNLRVASWKLRYVGWKLLQMSNIHALFVIVSKKTIQKQQWWFKRLLKSKTIQVLFQSSVNPRWRQNSMKPVCCSPQWCQISA